MPLTLEDILIELNALMPDNFVRRQAFQGDAEGHSNEHLARFVINVAMSLHSADSTDAANLERIAVTLEDASFRLEMASRRLRRLGE